MAVAISCTPSTSKQLGDADAGGAGVTHVTNGTPQGGTGSQGSTGGANAAGGDGSIGVGGAGTAGGSGAPGGAALDAGNAGRAGETPEDAGPVAADSGAPISTKDEEALFVPQGLPNTNPRGGELVLVAFTLAEGEAGLELYAAARNDGEAPVCNAGIIVDFYDTSGQQVATAGTGLQSGRLYRLNDDSGNVTTCIAPGSVAMAGLPELPFDVAVEELGHLEHSFQYFGLQVVELEVVSLGELRAVTSDAGTAFVGEVTNLLDATVRDPEVHVFPMNRVGRPLGMATRSESVEIAPGGTWRFETTAVPDAGTSAVGFATVFPPSE